MTARARPGWTDEPCLEEIAMKRQRPGVRWFVLTVCLWASQAAAQQTYKAASCGLADVQTAINNEIAHAVDGDVITIPAGTCTWTGSTPLSGTFTTSVTVQGAGAISATTGGASTTGSDQTVIIDNLTGRPSSTVSFTIASGKTLRVTGFSLQINASSTNPSGGMISLSPAGDPLASSMRIDHMHLAAGLDYYSLFVHGIGVADHILFDYASFRVENGVNWGGVNDNTTGDSSWADGDNWGTNKFFFVEDCRFHNGAVSDAHNGGRYVFRHNTGTADAISGQNNLQMFNHGLTNNRWRATRAAEVYQNSFIQPQKPGGPGAGNPFYSINSGTLLFWGNTVSQFRGAVQMDYSRKQLVSTNYTYGPTPGNWGWCGSPSNWDQNTNSSGYPCLDQAARGKGDLLNFQFFPNTLNAVTNSIAWPHQALSPLYLWLNTYTPSSGYSPTAPLLANADPNHYTQNVDYYLDGGTFNGTTGIGTGTLPPTNPAAYTNAPHCTAGPGGNTPGVGYWSSTNNTLYVCTATNTWTAYYTPYTYPHPLQGGSAGTAPGAPSNLTATVH
jgi:hypothetical protein